MNGPVCFACSLVVLSRIPRVLSEERDEQKYESGEEAREENNVKFEATCLRCVKGHSCETEDPDYSADDSDKRRYSLLLTQDL